MIAMVTGASRGIGRGTAIALADAGVQVFATGRSIESADLPAAVTRIRCDHLDDEQTAAAFALVQREAGGLDVLVNGAWGGYETLMADGVFVWARPFWEEPARRWKYMM